MALPYTTEQEVTKICKQLIGESGSQPQPKEKVKACPIDANLEDLCINFESIDKLVNSITENFEITNDIIKLVTNDGFILEGYVDLAHSGGGCLSCFLEDGHHTWTLIGAIDGETGEAVLESVMYNTYISYHKV